MILVLFYVWEDARIWGHWNSFWDIYLTKSVFIQITEYLILFFIQNSFQDALLVSNLSELQINSCRTKWWAIFLFFFIHGPLFNIMFTS